jgi:transcriptional regulator with XRE-family HTH domain
MTNKKLNFAFLAVAGVSQGEFAVLCGVSRVTVNLWVNGRSTPHRYLVPHVTTVLDSIAAAFDAHRLPIPGHIKKGSAHLSAVRAATATA